MTSASVPSARGGLPLLGFLPAFRNHRLQLLTGVAEQCGDFGTFDVVGSQLYLANSSELAHEILVRHAEDFEKTDTLKTATKPVLGNGLLTSDNEFHRRQRRLMAPLFQPSRIQTYVEAMAEAAERSWNSWSDGQQIDVSREMMRLTLEVVGKVLFGEDVRNDADELGKALTTVQRWATTRFTSLFPIPYSWRTPANRRAQEATARLDATIYRLIADRRSDADGRQVLLSLLLRARDEDDGSFMTDQQVRDEAMTLFLAGHETTANALAWTWYLLAQHSSIYARLRNEVSSVLRGSLPSAEDLPRLAYVTQVLKEAIRLYPPAYLISRQARQEVVIGGYRLPGNRIVLISPYTLHRRKDYFPDPERFDPDRFTPQAEESRPRFAYLPFGAGPRICIGNHFALTEGTVVLAALAQQVELKLVPGQQIEAEPLITLRPKHGIQMIVHKEPESKRRRELVA